MTDTIPSTNPNWRNLAWGLALLAFAVPFIAGFFTEELNWSPFDYVVWALLLLGLGGSLEFAARLVRTRQARVFAMLAICAVFFLLWAELATGGISRRLIG